MLPGNVSLDFLALLTRPVDAAKKLSQVVLGVFAPRILDDGIAPTVSKTDIPSCASQY